MTRNTEHDARADLEHRAQTARDNGVGSDWLRDIDDLAPARPNVWLVCAFIAIIAALVMVLPGCGGGIDTADEFIGPPVFAEKREAPPLPPSRDDPRAPAARCCPPDVPCTCPVYPG
jgi:hypothetical protein